MKSTYALTVGVLLVLSVIHQTHAAQWSYNDIEKWPGVCSSGKAQSPIDLLHSESVEKAFNPFDFQYYEKAYSATMINNQHSVVVQLNSTIGQVPTITGASLPNVYALDHMHFHWNSEHTVDGRRYPLELHLVHFNRAYGNFKEAVKHKDGIAVLGVLFNISPDDDSDMQQLVEIIDNIGKNPHKPMTLLRPIVPKNFLPCDTAGFFRYAGSLTTPGCDEIVIWTVFTNKQTLSMKQVKAFEAIHSDHGPLMENFRPLQPLNGRTIWLKQSPIDNGSSKPISTLVFVLVAPLILLSKKLF